MSCNPKAPPVYAPASLGVKSPPVYRPSQTSIPTAQLKAAGNLRIETRPVPLLPRPRQIQPNLQLQPNTNLRLETRHAPPVYSPRRNSRPNIQLQAVNFRPETAAAPPIYRPQSGPDVQFKAVSPLSSAPVSQKKGNLPVAGNVDSSRRPIPLVIRHTVLATAHQAPPRAAAWLPTAVQRATLEVKAKTEEVKEGETITASVRVEESSKPKPPAKILAEVRKIVDAAAKAGGKAHDPHHGVKLLNTILTDDKVVAALPRSSEATYAVASIDSTSVVYVSGPKRFVKAVSSYTSNSEDVGTRSEFVHGESYIFIKQPTIKSVAATQDNCLFCYGFLETQNISHQRLRDSPFPKGWIHPSLKFKLTLTSPQYGPKGMLVWITFAGEERLYRIDKLGSA